MQTTSPLKLTTLQASDLKKQTQEKRGSSQFPLRGFSIAFMTRSHHLLRTTGCSAPCRALRGSRLVHSCNLVSRFFGAVGECRTQPINWLQLKNPYLLVCLLLMKQLISAPARSPASGKKYDFLKNCTKAGFKLAKDKSMKNKGKEKWLRINRTSHAILQPIHTSSSPTFIFVCGCLKT